MYLSLGLRFIPVSADSSAIELERAMKSDKKFFLQESPKRKQLKFFVGYGHMAMYRVGQQLYFWNSAASKFLLSKKSKIRGSQMAILAGLPWFSNIKCDEN